MCIFAQTIINAVEPSAEAVTISGLDGHIICGNSSVERVYRRPLDQIIGKHPLIFCPQTPEWDELSKEIWTAIEELGHWDGVVINIDLLDQSEFPVLLRIRNIENEGQIYVISWARPFPRNAPFQLTNRQAQCFDLLGRGRSVGEIAAHMDNINESTVRTYLRRIWSSTNIQDNFNLSTLTELAIRCAEAGWDPTMRLNVLLGE